VSAVALRWGPSAQAGALTVVAALALAVAVVLRRVDLLALATPALWSLLVPSRQPEPTSVAVRVGAQMQRAQEQRAPEQRAQEQRVQELRAREGEPCPVEVVVVLSGPAEHVRAELALPSPLRGQVAAADTSTDRLVVTGAPVLRRWGRHRLGPLRVELLSAGGLRSAVVDLPVPLDVLALPLPLPLASASAPPLLRNRLGEHVTRAAGHGTEPIGVRPFAAGDPVRRVNWRVSSRRQALHVTVAAAERSVDVVLVLDALSDVGTPPDTSLDRTVRTAAGMAERWSRERDRVGLLVLGGSLRWLHAASGRVQEQRIAEAVLWAWSPPGEVPPDIDRVPRAVLPDGAVVVVLSPLLEPRALLAVDALRRRTSHLVVVDVLGDAVPAVDRKDAAGRVAARLWRLERAAQVDRFRRTGTPVLQPHDGELDRLLALALRASR